MTSTCRIYTVLVNSEGARADAGHDVTPVRFRRRDEAERFAVGRWVWGSPARVEAEDVPRRIAARWGLV